MTPCSIFFSVISARKTVYKGGCSLRTPKHFATNSLSLFYEMSHLPYFVDLQGFVVRESFVVKEFGILKNGQEIAHYVFRPPVPWRTLSQGDKRCARWLMEKHHRLHWYDGDVVYRHAISTIRRIVGRMMRDEESPMIYVKGVQKRTWLRTILGSLARRLNIKIETMEADFEETERLARLMTTRPTLRCWRHSAHCAMENVLKLYVWWLIIQRRTQ